MLGAAYTHYYALFAAGLNVLIAGIWGAYTKNKSFLRHWLLAALGMLAGYLPWLPVLYRQMSGSNAASWIRLERAQDYILELVRLDTPFLRNGLLYLLLFYGAVMLVKSREMEKRERLWAGGNVAVFFCVFLFCYAISVVKAPVIMSRYLMIAFILLPLALSIVSRYLPKLLFMLIMVFMVYAGIFQYRNAYNIQNPDVKGSVELLAGTIGENDIIYTDIAGYSMYLEYYMGRKYNVCYMENLDTDIINGEPGWIATMGRLEEPEWEQAEYTGEGEFKRLFFKLYRWRTAFGKTEDGGF